MLQVTLFIARRVRQHSEATPQRVPVSAFQVKAGRMLRRNKELDSAEMGLHLNPITIHHSTRLTLEGGLAHMTNRVITFFLMMEAKQFSEMFVFLSDMMRLVV